MSPCVVLAWKFGATEPKRNRGCSAGVARNRLKMGEACLETNEVCVALRRDARSALRAKDAAIVLAIVDCQLVDAVQGFVRYWRELSNR